MSHIRAAVCGVRLLQRPVRQHRGKPSVVSAVVAVPMVVDGWIICVPILAARSRIGRASPIGRASNEMSRNDEHPGHEPDQHGLSDLLRPFKHRTRPERSHRQHVGYRDRNPCSDHTGCLKTHRPPSAERPGVQRGAPARAKRGRAIGRCNTMLDRDLPSAEEAIRAEHGKIVATLARGTVTGPWRTCWNELSEPGVSLGAAPNGGMVPLRCERSDRPAELIIHVPDATVRAKEPGCADGTH
jgi:hypothetical protein